MDEDKPLEDKEAENMDEYGKKFEDPSTDQAPGQLPAGPDASGGQHEAARDAVQQDIEGDTGSNSGAVKSSKKPVVVLTSSGVTSDGSAQWKADLMPTQINSGLLSKTRVHNGGTISPVRASKRNATTSEQESLRRQRS